ncbi:MAG TPA: hypothetical protein DDW42_01920 [Desulfobacteraceae bacterium]|nr:hypothetical protein [Desulfobacteraceae bacterium]
MVWQQNFEEGHCMVRFGKNWGNYPGVEESKYIMKFFIDTLVLSVQNRLSTQSVFTHYVWQV